VSSYTTNFCFFELAQPGQRNAALMPRRSTWQGPSTRTRISTLSLVSITLQLYAAGYGFCK
jgi:hypothetical protein